MSHYKSNLRDIEFNLFEVLGRDEVLGTGPFAEVDGETAREVLAEVERLAREDLAASLSTGNIHHIKPKLVEEAANGAAHRQFIVHKQNWRIGKLLCICFTEKRWKEETDSILLLA